MTGNRNTQEAPRARDVSEFIKRVEDFARYMTPEYINDSDNPRSLTIIAADCLDAKSGRHAMAHVMVGDSRVGRCALRSMMEEDETFSAQVHELCDDDGGSRSVEDLDGEIGRKKKRLACSMWTAVANAAWSAMLIVMAAVGISSWITTVSSLLLMAFTGMLISRDIRMLRRDMERLKQQRRRAAGRRKIMGRMAQFGQMLRQMRNELEEDAGEDEED